MKIYNEDLTQELLLENLDFKKGYLKDDKKSHLIPEQKEVKEEGHYETIQEYPNGGKDIEWKIDIPAQEYIPEHLEWEDVKVYVPYTKEELINLGWYEYSEEELKEIEKQNQIIEREKQIQQLKESLAASDYEAIKFAEGWFTEEEYEPIRMHRQASRDLINRLEEEIQKIENGEEIISEEHNPDDLIEEEL